jgi:hypothetical protein
MRRRILLAAGGALGLAGVVGVGGAARAAGSLATVSVDLARSRGAFPFGLGRQLSAAPKSWRYGTDATASLDSLRLQRARVWLKYPDMAPVGGGAPVYDGGEAYLDYWAARADRLLLNWQTGYDQFASQPGFSLDAFVAAQAAALTHYKTRYPEIDLVEAENEDFGSGEGVAGYYVKYTVVYRVVAAVNQAIAAGRVPGPALKVGGPAIDVFSELRLGQFLDAYRADPRGDKRLDFVSYHQYLINTGSGDWTATKDYPAVVAGERARVTQLLSARGLPVVPVHVTEIGIFPGTRASSLGFEADLHIQAAALASLHYHYCGQPGIVPFDWTVDHPENDRKDLFVDTGTGVPRPYLNALGMLSMLPGTRYVAASDSLSARGTGVYGLAGADPARIAVMTWNYQWTATAGYDSRIVLGNLPSAFRTRMIRVTRYRQAATVHSGALAPVETFTIGPRTSGTYYGQTLPLMPNELRLTVLALT